MLLAKGIDCDKIVRGVQPICFDNAVWAYTLGTAIAVKRGLTDAAECAAAIGEGLEAFTIPGSVAEQRQVGLGHGNLGARLLSEDTTCFAFLAGHESFAAEMCIRDSLVCDAINVAMRELVLQIVYGRSQTAFSENGLPDVYKRQM